MNYSEKLNYLIPGGAHTYSRGDDQYSENTPHLFEKGEGAYLYTPDGKKYLDYGMALRAVTVGYGEKTIAQAAIDQIYKGNNLTRPSLVELEAAQLLTDLIPSCDMVKFAKNGSTVTTAAVKIARAYTGRKYVLRCLDHPFFSYDDWFIGDTTLKRGIPEEFYNFTLNFNYNDIQSVQAQFDKYPGQIACVIMEPATLVHPKDNFLQNIKDIAHKDGAVFILDEMITGFRWHLQGAQTYYGVEPDLCTFGKGIANGFSVAALGGKREIMKIGGIKEEGAERVFLISTTYGAEMCGLGAFIETVKFYKEHNVVEHLWDFGKKLQDGINSIAKDYGIEKYFEMIGIPCLPNYSIKDKNGENSYGLRTLFLQEMINNKVLIPFIAPAYAHKDEELNLTLEAARNSLKILAMGIEDGYEKFVKGPIVKYIFRKYN